MSTPLVSIALRSYNQKEFLKEAIDSILNQTFKDYELIIADDCSSDGSQEMIKDYQNKYPQIIKPIFADINGGHTINMNRALEACCGKYVAIFDGDDIMMPEKLEKQVDFMEKHPECPVSYHNVEFFDSKTGRPLFLKNGARNSHEGGIKTVVKYGIYFSNPSCIVKRDKIPQYGCDERVKIASDWLFYIDILAQGGDLLFLDEVLMRQRRHPGNVTKKQRVKVLRDLVKTIIIIQRKYSQYTFLLFYRLFAGVLNQFNTKLYK